MDTVSAFLARNKRGTVTAVVAGITFLIAFAYGRAGVQSPSNCSEVPGIVIALTYMSSIVLALAVIVIAALVAYMARSKATFAAALLVAVLIPVGVFVGTSVTGPWTC